MKIFLFSLTNNQSERNYPFTQFFSKNDKISINLMSKNKLKFKYLTTIFYPLAVILLTPILLARLLFKVKNKNVLVLFPGILELLILSILKLIFKIDIFYDAFTSFYLTIVEDRKLIKKNSFIAKILIRLDKLTVELSDVQIFETKEMKDYYSQNLKLQISNYCVIKSSREINPAIPTMYSSDFKEITFWGSFEAMHGLDYIIDAAEILSSRSEIRFNLIGNGPYRKHIQESVLKRKLNNVVFFDFLDKDPDKEDNLYKKIEEAEICLGTFSDGLKNNLVIPGKIVEAMQMGKPVVTANTLYMKNNCSDAAVLVKPENGLAIAEGIISLLDDEKKALRIVNNANSYFQNNHSINIFNEKLSSILFYNK